MIILYNMDKLQLIIALILILIIMYLLEPSNCEFFTNYPSAESLINNFNNTASLGVTNSSGTTTVATNAGINPILASAANTNKDLSADASLGINPNVVDMTKVGGQAVDSNIINYYSQQMASDMKQEAFNVKDFLPKEINSEWFQTDLSNAKNELDQASLIEINKYCSGIDTVGQSLKNPSYDIRGNIPCPKIVVSPWMNSSIDVDNNIKSWC